jgi:CheY-like chemotaxis protein
MKVQMTRRIHAAKHACPAYRVLVADADADTRALYQNLLALAECEVIEAGDGRDALTKALLDPPTAVITELRLPMIDGISLCEILRRDEATRAVPILVVTAEARSTELERVRKAGANAVLVKPTTPEAIQRELQRLLMRPSVDDSATTGHDDPGADPSRAMLVKVHARYKTSTPPSTPPDLMCPSCDHSLGYDHSFIGGVSRRHPEQWDYYVCHTCGTFQYRQRTRKLNHVTDEW